MTDTLDGLDGKGVIFISPSQSTKKQAPLRKGHFFTLNNYTEVEIDGFLTFFKLHATKYAFQEEIAPTTGTPHLQGMVIFTKEKRSTAWDPKGRGCYFKLKDESGAYQLKEESRKPNGRQWTKGFPKPVKIIENLYPWQLDIETIFLQEPDDRKIYWFYDENGNIGKSAFVKYMVVKHKCLFCDGGKKADLINLVFNNDMDECKCVIWDLPRSTGNSISYSTIESVKNGMVCNTKYETGVKCFNSPHIFVFSNCAPDTSALSADRWIIKNIGKTEGGSTRNIVANLETCKMEYSDEV